MNHFVTREAGRSSGGAGGAPAERPRRPRPGPRPPPTPPPPFARGAGGPRGPQVAPKQQLQGVNVCGGQCCPGWSKAPGSQRCTKPSCVPPCLNGGMCLRPQLCVCKPGTRGKACELTTAREPAPTVLRTRSAGRPASPRKPPEPAAQLTSSEKADAVPRASPVAQMTLTLKPKPPSVSLSPQPRAQVASLTSQNIMIHRGQTQAYVLRPKDFAARKVMTSEQATEGAFPLRSRQELGSAPFQVRTAFPQKQPVEMAEVQV
ncbi:latent-transforming growth factor beta-binding protein 1-like [Sorex fumeus]|uniref:latent-transforming growth factor beta-binding protein 1-like n=1 Tax=Sorex fumeus TaxID=62283 RepID=UPI0024AD0CC7|nr:latent-transforming growth factor beta-binding protein 1-like [Sorex fumeus]